VHVTGKEMHYFCATAPPTASVGTKAEEPQWKCSSILHLYANIAGYVIILYWYLPS